MRIARRAEPLVVAAGCVVGFGALAAALAALVQGRLGPVLRGDAEMVSAATGQIRDEPTLLHALLVWEQLSQPRWVYLAAALVCVWVWRRRQLTSQALWAFLTMMACWNVAFALKHLFQRSRPTAESALTHAAGFSFPSGHATNSAAAASALLLLLWPLLGAVGRCAAVGGAATFVVVTAADRVLLGAHYPSDVVAGVVLGVGMVLTSYAGYRAWDPRRHAPAQSGSG